MPPTSGDEPVFNQPLPEDHAPPASPPDTSRTAANQDIDREIESARLDDSHEAADSNIDSHELYDEGISGAAEATEPNAGNAVTGYQNPDS